MIRFNGLATACNIGLSAALVNSLGRYALSGTPPNHDPLPNIQTPTRKRSRPGNRPQGDSASRRTLPGGWTVLKNEF